MSIIKEKNIKSSKICKVMEYIKTALASLLGAYLGALFSFINQGINWKNLFLPAILMIIFTVVLRGILDKFDAWNIRRKIHRNKK